MKSLLTRLKSLWKALITPDRVYIHTTTRIVNGKVVKDETPSEEVWDRVNKAFKLSDEAFAKANEAFEEASKAFEAECRKVVDSVKKE